ncbi:MAG: capsid cement protein, partial [Bacteroidota bacterium]
TGVAYTRTDEKGILMPNAAVASTQHAKAYWDADGDPVGGTAGSGAVTNVATDNVFIGYFADAAADTDEEAVVHLTGA